MSSSRINKALVVARVSTAVVGSAVVDGVARVGLGAVSASIGAYACSYNSDEVLQAATAGAVGGAIVGVAEGALAGGVGGALWELGMFTKENLTKASCVNITCAVMLANPTGMTQGALILLIAGYYMGSEILSGVIGQQLLKSREGFDLTAGDMTRIGVIGGGITIPIGFVLAGAFLAITIACIALRICNEQNRTEAQAEAGMAPRR